VGGTNDLDQPSRTSDLLGQAGEDHWSRIGAQVGLERQFDDNNRARLDLGYQVLEFDHSSDSEFSGLVGHLRYRRRFSDALSVNGDIIRQPVQSSFDVNNYFIMLRARANVQFQPRGTSLYYFGAVSFQTSTYPDETQLSANREFNRRREDFLGAGFHRRDKISSLDLGVGMRFSDLSSLDLSVSARQRDSNLTPVGFVFDEQGEIVVLDRSLDRLSYDELVFGLSLRDGFTPPRNYI